MNKVETFVKLVNFQKYLNRHSRVGGNAERKITEIIKYSWKLSVWIPAYVEMTGIVFLV